MAERVREIGDLWRAIHLRMHELMRHSFRGSGLSFMALIILRQIQREPGITVSELARRSGTVKSHVSKMMDQLADQGYVEKRADPDDLRLVRVYVTQPGLDSLAEQEARVREALDSVVDEIPAGQQDTVVCGLRVLLAAFESSNRLRSVESFQDGPCGPV